MAHAINTTLVSLAVFLLFSNVSISFRYPQAVSVFVKNAPVYQDEKPDSTCNWQSYLAHD